MQVLSYVLPFRFEDKILFFDPTNSEIICQDKIDDSLKELFVKHIRENYFPQDNEEIDAELRNMIAIDQENTNDS